MSSKIGYRPFEALRSPQALEEVQGAEYSRRPFYPKPSILHPNEESNG